MQHATLGKINWEKSTDKHHKDRNNQDDEENKSHDKRAQGTSNENCDKMQRIQKILYEETPGRQLYNAKRIG